MSKVVDLNAFREKKEQEIYEEDERIMEQQYQEFVSLLKYFIHTQELKIDIVHIEFTSATTYTLKDNDGQHLEYEDDVELTKFLGDDLVYEDLLISALIDLSPQTLAFSNSNLISDKMKETITSIFGGTRKISFQ